MERGPIDRIPLPGVPHLIGTEAADRGGLLAVACSAGVPRILIRHNYLGGGPSERSVNVRYGFDDAGATVDAWTLARGNRTTMVPERLTETVLAEMERSERFQIRLTDPTRGTHPEPDGGALVLEFSLLDFTRAKQDLPCL
jgi:hypothetical protein